MTDVKLRLLRSSETEPATAEELLHQASLGSEEAFSELYDLLSKTIYGVVLRVLRDPAMAEEVTQEVFVELWRVATRFEKSKGSARGWASTIAHRKAVDRVRSEQARRDREDRDHTKSYQPEHDTVADTFDRASDRTQVLQALDELTEAQRESVMLAYFGGHTYREVAVLLGVPEGTVKTRIRDGLVKLRDKIGVPL